MNGDELKVTYTLEEISEMALVSRYHSLAVREVLIEYIAGLTKLAYPDRDLDVSKLTEVFRDNVLKVFQTLLESDSKISESLQQKILDNLKDELGLK